MSGTALDQILARRLQDGDPGGHMRRALNRFPVRAMADRVYQTSFIEGGKAERAAYKRVPMLVKDFPRELQELIVVVVTSGDGLPENSALHPADRLAYRAADVIAVLHGTQPPSARERAAVRASQQAQRGSAAHTAVTWHS